MEMLIYIRDYQESYKIGDIVEVRPDEYWTVEHGYNAKAFKLLTRPGEPVNNDLIKPEHKERRISERRKKDMLFDGYDKRILGQRRLIPERRDSSRELPRRRKYNISLIDTKLPISKDNIGTEIVEKDAIYRGLTTEEIISIKQGTSLEK